MNGKLSKKIRKEINKKARLDMLEIFRTIGEENIFIRIRYAFKIVFKYKLGKPLEV